VLKN
jgi:hypothetical protein